MYALLTFVYLNLYSEISEYSLGESRISTEMKPCLPQVTEKDRQLSLLLERQLKSRRVVEVLFYSADNAANH